MQIFIFFPEDAKVGVKTLKVYLDRMKDSNASRAILVVQQNLTAFGKNILATFQPKYIVEVVCSLLLTFLCAHALKYWREVQASKPTYFAHAVQ